MALDQSALLEVLEVRKSAEVDDRIRQAAETIYQALIEAELTAVIGAFPHQRTASHLAWRHDTGYEENLAEDAAYGGTARTERRVSQHHRAVAAEALSDSRCPGLRRL
jgi:hypothetical protein